jgi:cytochrome c oxidase subunit 2
MWRKGGAGVGVVAATVLLAACGDSDSPSALDPQGPGASRLAGLWWFLFGISAFVFAVVMGLLAVGLWRRRRDRQVEPGEGRSMRLVLGGGLVFPVVVLSVVFVVTLRIIEDQEAPLDRTRMTVEVRGHDWWWEVNYPEEGVTTANEIHIPTGRPVRVEVITDDVIHSLWVPQLQAKIDMFPGYHNVTWLEADRPGRFRGQCAEFCGLQHANMAFVVVAHPPAAFQDWLDRERRPAAEPGGPNLARGREVFLENACVGCHAIRGTAATARVGPDLTHFASREAIGAETVENNRGNLAGWVVDSQSLKPGNKMPPVQLSPAELEALLDYLQSLR